MKPGMQPFRSVLEFRTILYFIRTLSLGITC